MCEYLYLSLKYFHLYGTNYNSFVHTSLVGIDLKYTNSSSILEKAYVCVTNKGFIFEFQSILGLTDLSVKFGAKVMKHEVIT